MTISGDKPQVTVKNGTVTGGRNLQNGGGFAIDNAVVQLEALTITGNKTVGGNGNGEVGGGGIYALHADVSMQNVTVSENSVTGSNSDGGGILVRCGSLTMDGCHVEGNTAPDCGGGGGGSHKPTVTIPDDVPTGLNGDDHYAYIVGYPDSTVRPQNGITWPYRRLRTATITTSRKTSTRSGASCAKLVIGPNWKSKKSPDFRAMSLS